MAPKRLSHIFDTTLQEIAKTYCAADLDDRNERAAFASMIDAVLEETPHHALANALKGDILCHENQYAEALPHLLKAHDAGLKEHGVPHNFAEALFWTNDFAAAQPLLEEMSEQYPDDFHVTFMLAYTALKLGDKAGADALFARCIDNLEDLQHSYMPQIKEMLSAKYSAAPQITTQPNAEL